MQCHTSAVTGVSITANIHSPETFASTSPHVECTLIDKQRWPWPTPSFGCCSLPAIPAPSWPLYIGSLAVTQTRTLSSSSNTCRNRRLRKPDSSDPQPTYNMSNVIYNHKLDSQWFMADIRTNIICQCLTGTRPSNLFLLPTAACTLTAADQFSYNSLQSSSCLSCSNYQANPLCQPAVPSSCIFLKPHTHTLLTETKQTAHTSGSNLAEFSSVFGVYWNTQRQTEFTFLQWYMGE